MLNNGLFVNGDKLVIDKANDFIAEMPRGIKTRQELFAAIKSALNLPDYFGYNWDALSECLRDLSWIRQRRVIIVHHDVPNLTKTELEEYSDILATSAKYWATSNKHEFLVIMD